MSVKIHTVPSAVLKEKALAVDIENDKDFRNLAEQMMELMYSCDGCGMAAPQLGILKRLIVVDYAQRDENNANKRYPIFLVNPEIVSTGGERKEEEEGCLSIPGVSVSIMRPDKVVVRAFDLDGEEFEIEANGFPARVLQHEIDHLEGRTLFEHLNVIDRIEKFSEYEIAVANGARPGQTNMEDSNTQKRGGHS